MPKVYLSTLLSIQNHLDVSLTDLKMKIRGLSAVLRSYHTSDPLISISSSCNQWIDDLCKNMVYPECIICKKFVCGNGRQLICQCDDNTELVYLFQKEHEEILLSIRRTENSLLSLSGVPFRQLRNAYGFSSGIFGGINFLLTKFIATITIGVFFSIAIVPAIFFGVYVYIRGYREEKKIIADSQADLISKKFHILYEHKKSVSQRYHYCLNRVHNVNIEKMKMPNKPKTLLKRPKEKRSNLGNPLGHFIIAFLATLSVLGTIFLKVSFIASVLGGPIGWGIAAGIALGVGLFFAYKRYSHLVAKKKFDHNMAILDARSKDIQDITHKYIPKIGPQYKTLLNPCTSKCIDTNKVSEKQLPVYYKKNRYSNSPKLFKPANVSTHDQRKKELKVIRHSL